MANSKTYGLTHLAIAVKDVNRTLKFYQQVFDMQTMYHENGFIQLTTPGCNDILVFEEKKDSPIGQTGGIAHFGFRLKDAAGIEEITNKVINAGGKIVPAMPSFEYNPGDFNDLADHIAGKVLDLISYNSNSFA